MAVNPPARPSPGPPDLRDRPARTAEPVGPTSLSPVVVLATAHSGADQLHLMLNRDPELACTSGTGILPLCEQALAVCCIAEGRPGGSASPLAISTTRALASSMIVSVLAREGKRRWCEISSAMPDTAETFTQLYPGTRFLCLYRACPGFIRATLDASPWGITDPIFTPYTRAYPATTIAALTAYWVTYTGSLLAFEKAHPHAALRIRFEDLATAEDQTTEKIMSFISTDPADSGLQNTAGSQAQPQTSTPNPDTDLPVGLIPPPMLAQANDLLSQLSYPALPAPTR